MTDEDGGGGVSEEEDQEDGGEEDCFAATFIKGGEEVFAEKGWACAKTY